jgi:hypothetical protein
MNDKIKATFSVVLWNNIAVVPSHTEQPTMWFLTYIGETMKANEIIIDPEIKNLIPPLSPSEYAGLEASILSEGCRDAVVIWQETEILLDGHNRYQI